MRGRVLIVDDDPNLCETLRAGLAHRGFDCEVSESAIAALQALDQREFDVMLADLRLGAIDGLELCRRIATAHPPLPVIVMTAFGNLDAAIAAIRAGAYDFVTKPINTDELGLILDRAVQIRRLREEVRQLRATLAERTALSDLIGDSAAMRQVGDLVARLAPSDAAVLITGETGTGKEVVARLLHRLSGRTGPFVALNCATLPEMLLESELFGHLKGAFTGADKDRRGLFAEAEGGTIFLDEIGSLPLGLQPKLLRALQERRLRPVGGVKEAPFSARIVAATNRDLSAAVERGEFREDLYYRLDVLHVEVPPLRARSRDILQLAQHFIQEIGASAGKTVVGMSESAAQKLLDYEWPGNVRELRNCIERAIALTQYSHLTVDDLHPRIRDYKRSHVLVVGENPAELVPLEEIERRYIRRVLDAVGGNRTLASRVLGLDRKTLYRRLEQMQRGGGDSSVAPDSGRSDNPERAP